MHNSWTDNSAGKTFGGAGSGMERVNGGGRKKTSVLFLIIKINLKNKFAKSTQSMILAFLEASNLS